MMIIMQFTFQIILLAVGFGVGYLLLLSSKAQEDNLKILGQSMGWILIGMAVILAILSCYYSMQIANKGYMQGGCPVQRIIEQKDGTTDTEQGEDSRQYQKGQNKAGMDEKESGESEEPETTPDISGENENKPVKNNINDRQ